MTLDEHQHRKVIEIFLDLQKLGCSLTNNIVTNCDFGGLNKPLKIKIKDIDTYSRLIRSATILEQQGVLIAHTDRMGRVVGWHYNKPVTSWNKDTNNKITNQ